MKKSRIATLLSVISASLLASCTNTSSSVTPEEETKKVEIAGAVHEVKVTDRPDRKFINSEGSIKSTDYKIIFDSKNDSTTRAAAYISSNLFNATGAEFVMESEDSFFAHGGTVSGTTKVIIVGCDDLFESAGLTYPEKTRVSGGYYIKNIRNAYYIQSDNAYGYQLGSLSFLKYAAGFDFVSEDTITYSENEISTIPDMEIVECSDFELNTPVNAFTSNTRYGLGYMMQYPFMLPKRDDGRTGIVWHNIFDYVPTAEFIDAHPEWYSTGAHTQLCYSARGNKTEYKAMVEQVAKVVNNTVDANPDRILLNITSNDIGTACECDECIRLKQQDGAYSGQVIRFMNDVDNIMQAHLREVAAQTNTPKRTVHLQFFSYLAYQDAPKVSPEEDPTLKCNDELMVCIAPLHANFTKTFEDEVNEDYARSFIEWNKYVKNIASWLYSTNYHHYMYPYNTYTTMMDIYRFCRQYGAKLMLDEGQRFSANIPCFARLKEYLSAKAMFDVTSSCGYYTDKWFKDYFLEAEPLMREYFEELVGWETRLENDPSTGLGGGVYEEIGSTASFWPKQLLLNWIDKMDEAARAVEKYSATNNALYKVLIKHINIERMFPMFVLCDKHADSYTEAEITALRRQFKALADELGLIEFAEHNGDISIKYNEWGIA